MNSVSQRGFSLLEVLVAFSIMAFGLGGLYQALGGSTRNLGIADQRARAVMIAESLLSLYSAIPPQGWNDNGREAGLDWTVASTPLGDGGGTLPWRLHQIDVVVRGNGRQFHLTTILPERTVGQ